MSEGKYDEPWGTDMECETIYTSKGMRVLDYFSIPHNDLLDRVCACVNACAGMPTEMLTQKYYPRTITQEELKQLEECGGIDKGFAYLIRGLRGWHHD